MPMGTRAFAHTFTDVIAIAAAVTLNPTAATTTTALLHGHRSSHSAMATRRIWRATFLACLPSPRSLMPSGASPNPALPWYARVFAHHSNNFLSRYSFFIAALEPPSPL